MSGFGPTGELVYQRTYSRVKPDGERETWPETVERVVDGNLGLVDRRHELDNEREDLVRLMTDFDIIPAGRHLWASGVKNAPFLFNCWNSVWTDNITDHFAFTFMRLMEGGGVGANYSNKYLEKYGALMGHDFIAENNPYQVHIVCDPEHPDYQKMKDAGLLSDEYVGDWDGAFAVEDSREGWAAALVDLIETYYRDAKNQNRVFDVSRVRGEGARLKTFGGRASGPLPLARMLHTVADVLNSAVEHHGVLLGTDAMEIDHAIAECVVSGGNRRSARMSIMHWADPQIEDFISIKEFTGKHWTTNISVEVDEGFFTALRKMDGGVHAQRVLRLIAEGMLKNGEPGFWNSGLSNVGEPNPVTSTNPCGEITLEEAEPCNLGHVNLANFIDETGRVDFTRMELAHLLMTRFLIRATFADVSDPLSREVLDRNRRIGVGHLGVASYLAKGGMKYSDAADSAFRFTLSDLSAEVDYAASNYCHALRIPVPVKTRTVAPTGTIAKMPGVSEGIHPIFAPYFIRRIRFSDVDLDQRATVEKYRAEGYGVEPCQYAPETTVVSLPTKDTLMAEVEAMYGEEKALEIVQSASDLTLAEMLKFQQMYQAWWADNAVSYTVNVDPQSYSVQNIMDALQEFGMNLKGATVFPEMSMPQSPYERISKADYEMYELYLRQISDGINENCANGACPIR